MDIGTSFQTRDLAQIASFTHSAGSLASKEQSEEPLLPKQKASVNTDVVTFSKQAENAVTAENSQQKQPSESNASPEETASDEPKLRDPNQATSPSGEVLSDQEQQEVEQLKRRDAEVRAHEQAHQSAAGNLSQGSVSFDYENGPDGKRYAVGGEVSIDTSTVSGDPQATLIKAQKIRRAATAPVDPSSQDRSVAAEASRMEAQARSEISQQGRQKQSEYVDENTPEVNFLAPQIEQNEKNIQDTYKKIQNTQVLEQQKSFVDFFI